MSMPTHRWGAPYRCLAWVLIASLLAASCATRNVPPIGAGGKPFKPESDEVRLWSQAEKEEEALAKKAKIYDDPLLEEYLGKRGDRRDQRLRPRPRARGGPGRHGEACPRGLRSERGAQGVPAPPVGVEGPGEPRDLLLRQPSEAPGADHDHHRARQHPVRRGGGRRR